MLNTTLIQHRQLPSRQFCFPSFSYVFYFNIIPLVRIRARSLLAPQETKVGDTATLACDIAIAVSSLRNLSGHKKETTLEARITCLYNFIFNLLELFTDRTNNMLDKLMIIAANRGVFTALCTAANMILVGHSSNMNIILFANIFFSSCHFPMSSGL